MYINDPAVEITVRPVIKRASALDGIMELLNGCPHILRARVMPFIQVNLIDEHRDFFSRRRLLNAPKHLVKDFLPD